MKILCASVLTFAAVMSAAAANPAVEETKRFYSSIKDNLIKAAEKMPDEAYSFAPTPEERTFGAMVGHVADAQIRICGAAAGQTKPAEAGKLTAKADLVKALKASFDFCDEAMNGLSDETAEKMMDFFGRGQTSKAGILQYNVMHDSESYGYMAVYMRLKGVVPPSSEKK